MMPNKKNPDPAELVRGRAARVIGSLAGMLALIKGLPLAYQRDLQEDKPPLFDAVVVLESSLGIMAGLIGTIAIDRGRMRAAVDEGYITATAVADALVRHGLPFRIAHHVVGSIVGLAERDGIGLDAVEDLAVRAALLEAGDPLAVSLAGESGIGDLVRGAASIEGALASCDVIGGTAPARVSTALLAARRRLDAGGG
jgi:argininosuccinate lyase